MIYPLIFEGLRNGGTFLLDETTKAAIAQDPTQIEGKIVALTDNFTVGYGSANDVPLGFVEKVEQDKSGSSNWVVSVVWNQSREDIPCAGSETAGSYLACDGSGGVSASTTSTSARCWGVDATEKVATVYIHG